MGARFELSANISHTDDDTNLGEVEVLDCHQLARVEIETEINLSERALADHLAALPADRRVLVVVVNWLLAVVVRVLRRWRSLLLLLLLLVLLLLLL